MQLGILLLHSGFPFPLTLIVYIDLSLNWYKQLVLQVTCMKNTIMVLFYCICPCDNFVQNKCLIISCSKHVYVQYCYYNMLIIIPKLHVLCVIFACMVCAIKHEQSHTQALEVYIHNRPFSVIFLAAWVYICQ